MPVLMIRIIEMANCTVTNTFRKEIFAPPALNNPFNTETGLNEDAAKQMLAAADGRLPVALVMAGAGVDSSEATTALETASGVVQKAIQNLRSKVPWERSS